MKIIHVTDTSIFNFDGISTYINELLECSYKNGDHLLLLSTVPLNLKKQRIVNHKAEIKEFKNMKIFSSNKFNFSLPTGMKNAIDVFKPDIIWIHTIGPLGLRAARLSKNTYPVIYTKHCFDGDLWCKHLKIPKGLQWFFHLVAILTERKMLRFSDVALYHFDNIEKIYRNKFFGKFQYMPPPLNERFLNERSFRNCSHNISTITLGYCGRLDPEKNIGLLFKAVDIYQKKYNVRTIRLLLIGDGPEASTLASQYPEINLTITGFVNDVIPYLDQLDAFVFASKTETTSLSSLEAYSRGLPVFTTHVGFLGQNAYKYHNIFNFSTPEELAMLINDILDVKKISVESPPIKLDPSIITFSKLQDSIASRYL